VQDAASVAGLTITTEAMVAEKRTEIGDARDAPGLSGFLSCRKLLKPRLWDTVGGGFASQQ
jgi:hypothetical protein